MQITLLQKARTSHLRGCNLWSAMETLALHIIFSFFNIQFLRWNTDSQMCQPITFKTGSLHIYLQKQSRGSHKATCPTYVTILVWGKSSLSEKMTEMCSVLMQLQTVYDSPAERRLSKYNYFLLENQSYSKCDVNRQKVSKRNPRSKIHPSSGIVWAANASVRCDWLAIRSEFSFAYAVGW